MKGISELSSYYASLSLSQKFLFFETDAHEIFQGLEGQDLAHFLKSVILDRNENSSLRKRAIEIHTDYVFVQKLKTRNELSLLIDDWGNDDDIFLEIRRQKDLFYFYEQDPQEIEKVYTIGTNKDEAEIQSESYFHLGLIDLLKALSSNKEDSINYFNKSQDHFVSSAIIIENRKDAVFFQNVVSLLIELLENRRERIQERLELLTQILWQREAMSFARAVSPFEIGFYRVLFSLAKITQSFPATWLDYRKEFSQLHYYFSEIKNAEIKERLSKSIIHDRLSNFLAENIMEPYFIINFSAEKARIEARLNEVDKSTEEYTFLRYLIGLVNNKSSKKKADQEIFRDKFRRIFPDRNQDVIEEKLSKVSDINNSNQLFFVLEELSTHDPQRFMDSLISNCVNLQGAKIHHTSSEDDRNSFVSILLHTQGYRTKDQTRWGISRGGKRPGEIDIMVYEKNGDLFTIIEALNLESLDRNYISLHLEKIFNYDTAGLTQNFILVYSSANNFVQLWKKYIDFIPEVNYPYSFIGFNEIQDYSFTDIKIGRAKHLRNEKEVFLFHIFVNMSYS